MGEAKRYRCAFRGIRNYNNGASNAMNETAIIWTSRSWNPFSGCEKVSEGCKFCYAETLAENKRGTPAFPKGFELTIRPHKLKEPFKEKEGQLIFVNSMSDMFWEKVDDSYRDKIVDVMEQTPWHEYQVLTKRPENMLRYSQRRKLPDNFWAGVTIENGRTKDRLAVLKKVKASIHFVSAEPLIGAMGKLHLRGIDWIITGGESGTHLYDKKERERRALVIYENGKWSPREDRIDWVREIRDACLAAGTKFFHKQWGGATPKSAGRLLDGRTWDEFPRLPNNANFGNKHHVKVEPDTLFDLPVLDA